MSLDARDPALRELMDDPDCDPARLRATLRRFGTVNRLVAGWGTVYRTRIRPFLERLDRPARVLDLGCGGGDVLESLARRARRDRMPVEWLGVDPDPRALEVALPRAAGGLRFACADAAGLLATGDTFDLVMSNHVLHHLGPDEVGVFADESRRLSRGIVLHGDIERSRTAYALYTVGVTPFAPGTFLRTDGLRSIRRSYRADELAAALGAPWRVDAPTVFRLLAEAPGAADG